MNTDGNTSRPRIWRWLCLMALVAMILRAAAHFRTSLVPGMDAAYYLVQSRSLLERGALQNPDLPLTFWIQAGSAWILQTLGGFIADDSIVLAVKLSDSVLPALAALPMGWLGWCWMRTETDSPSPRRWSAFRQLLPALVPAAIVSLSWPMMRMVGDFQKNALGLVWLALLIASSHAFVQRPSWRRAVVPVLAFALAAMTHIGVLGAAIVFIFMLLFSSSILLERKLLWRLALFIGIATVVAVAAVVAVASVTHTTKFDRLISAVTGLFSTSHFLGGNRGGPNLGFLAALPWVGLGAAIAMQVWRGRQQIPAADRVLAIACGLTSIALAVLDQQGRLILIAVIPTAASISFLLAKLNWPRWGARIGVGLLVVASFSGLFVLGARPVVNEEQCAELKQLTVLVQPAEQAVVFTQHGVEYWTNWVLHVNAKQAALIEPTFWDKYANVFYLVLKDDDRGRGPGDRPRKGPGPTDGPPRGRPGPQRPPGPNQPPDGRANDPRRNVKIPNNAEIMHDGVHFVLARVTAPQPEMHD